MSKSIDHRSLGVLHPKHSEKYFTLKRYPPHEALRTFIKHYWIVEWSLPAGESFSQEVIPNPCVNLILEKGRMFFYGPSSRKYSHELRNEGRVFGIKFKPGGFYPWIRKPISCLTDTPLSADRLLPRSHQELETIFLDRQFSHHELVHQMNQLLLPLLPPSDDIALQIEHITTHIQNHHELTKVDEVCAYFHMNKRKLQRLFQQYVGLTPKTVIRLYRLQNAAETLDRGSSISILKLCMDLGYHDQSHFIRDFKTVIGITPEAYIREHSAKINKQP